ncbi:MAG: peptidoglycan-associated lipoprotein Pal [Deltaproteobacteria bacterium]|nr:peptidoglycan-associated lipoprotein Pal [Deltaproteobacteria bacterium]
MRKKMMAVLLALAFVVSSLLLMSACAKKQMQVTEGVQPTAQETKAVEQPAAETATTEQAKKVEVGETEEYKKAEAERLEKLKALEKAQKEADEKKAFENEKIYFDFDKSDLKPEAQAVLKKKADWLREHPAYSLRIEGNCDERGTNEYNLALGERRANSAKKFLVALGIAEQRIATISYGEERPADPRHNEEAWAKNRRDEFKLMK